MKRKKETVNSEQETEKAPYITQFTQPDTIKPDPYNPLDWNRYAYARSNPLKYNDPDGHNPIIALLVFFGVAAVLSSDSTHQGMSPAEVNAAQNTIQQISSESSSSADALINLFTTDKLAGDSAQERFNTIVGATSNAPGVIPGLYFKGPLGDSGFTPSLQDPFPSSSNQVGHFLTGAAYANKSSNPGTDFFALAFITGHEMSPDGGLPNLFTQVGLGLTHPSASALFLGGTDDNFNQILAMGNPGEGNSIEDLRLSYLAWLFGKDLLNGNITTREEAAAWLEEHLK